MVSRPRLMSEKFYCVIGAMDKESSIMSCSPTVILLAWTSIVSKWNLNMFQWLLERFVEHKNVSGSVPRVDLFQS